MEYVIIIFVETLIMPLEEYGVILQIQIRDGIGAIQKMQQVIFKKHGSRRKCWHEIKKYETKVFSPIKLLS